MDQWTEQLSDYLDGGLDATSAARLEQHLRECAECRDVLADLRMIAAHASDLAPTQPARDLWPAIATQIATTPQDTADDNSGEHVISLDDRRNRTRRSITMSMPQLAAAAIILIVIGGTAVWKLQPSRQNDASHNAATIALNPHGGNTSPAAPSTFDSGTAAPANTAASNAARVNSPLRNVSTHSAPLATLGYDAAIQQLENAAAQKDDQLDPKTKAVIDLSMKTIDRAIADARTALAADPANAYLHRHLDRTMKQKLELLRQAAKIDRGGA